MGGGERPPPGGGGGERPAEAVAVSGAGAEGGPSLDDSKNFSRASDTGDSGRYDCRHVYRNMEFEADDGDTAAYRCGSWDCYCCAHRMRMNLIEEMERVVSERPQLRRFLTLTTDPATAPSSKDEQHRYLTERFNALRTELNDRYGNLSYIWVRHEGDERGRPHIHLLVDRYLSQSELSMLSERVGLGSVVDIRRVDARNAAKYITAYMGRAGSLAELPKGANRYGCSSDITLDVRGGGDDEREWRLMMDDHYITDQEGDPLRRGVTRSDLAQQKEWRGPVPPD